MSETWLRPNRRALWFGCVPPLILCFIGLWLIMGIRGDSNTWLRWSGILLMVAGSVMVIALVRQLSRPRIAFNNGHVLFYLRSGPPLAVPAEIVEAFFVGQGPAALPGGLSPPQQTANLVARLSQRATEWTQRDVKPALGNWCEGYVTIRGTWCEPLNAELVRRLNRRLSQVKTGEEHHHPS
jgi:hypothetical protein